MNTDCLMGLRDQSSFSRGDLRFAMSTESHSCSEALANKTLNYLLREELIARIGRNLYKVMDPGRKIYSYQYSELAENIAATINAAHPALEFTITELMQLNAFVNHLFGKNTIFVYVESGIEDYVFETLKDRYPGKVLLAPSVEEYDRYADEGTIVICKLISEAPKGKMKSWNTRLEKFLVDLMSESLLQEIISPGEYPRIYEEAFSRYEIDESCMFRYARRRNAEGRIRDFIRDETNISLRTE